jgi:predicted 3-demethylubiquinone-9 3-methyltransferase (glyoxalase superfamily)
MPQKITPFLWFNKNAEQAVKFYTSVFKKSKIVTVTRYDEATAKAIGQPKGSIMTIEFILNGQRLVVINGGPQFKLSEAVSLVVECQTQKEIDYFWNKLSAGGQKSHCGWLKDKFGLSWQIVPANWHKLLKKNTPKVMAAVMTMDKFDIKKMQKAAKG